MSLAAERQQSVGWRCSSWWWGRSLGRAVPYVTGTGSKDNLQSSATQRTRALASEHVELDVAVGKQFKGQDEWSLIRRRIVITLLHSKQRVACKLTCDLTSNTDVHLLVLAVAQSLCISYQCMIVMQC